MKFFGIIRFYIHDEEETCLSSIALKQTNNVTINNRQGAALFRKRSRHKITCTLRRLNLSDALHTL